MLVLFLILFTKVIADSDEDKYVDLLPDAEKRQFIENVARRILKDVESQENARQRSLELSDEQLQKHSDFVKTILKEETDNARINKEELAKGREEKPESDEKDGLDVKPLETEKIAPIPDDPDLDNVDLTLRNDRRGIGGVDKKSSEYIKVEIITDDPPIIKRSVPNDTSSDESGSDDFTSETSERAETKTVELNQFETTTGKSKNIELLTQNTETVNTTTKEPKAAELTRVVSKNNESESKNETLAEELTARTTETVESRSKESKEESSINKNSEQESTTTDSYFGGGIGLTAPKNKDSSESDEEDIKRKGLKDVGIWQLNDKNDLSKEKNTRRESTKTDMEYSGVKSSGNKSNEYNSVSKADIEEITTLTSPIESTTTEIPTTAEVNEVSTTYINSHQIEIQNNPITTLSTITSTLTDEGTTNLITETTPYTASTETVPQVETSTVPITTEYITESTTKPVATTGEMKILVEEFTSAPTVRTSADFITLKPESTTQTIPQKTKPTDDIRGLLSSIVKSSSEEGIPPHRIELPTIIIQKKVHDNNIIVNTAPIQKRKEPKILKFDDNTNKNFIDIEKLYFDNNYKVKMGKEYHVYEIPANKSPFTMDEGVMTDHPYYVPVYNYSPNHAYFNPTNRQGPNPKDIVSKEDLGTFAVLDDNDEDKAKKGADISIDNNSEVINENTGKPNVDMDYSVSAFNIKRKKFGNQQKSHSMHKMPQQKNSKDKKRGNGKVIPEDYLDSDYYFGRKRKHLLDRRVNHNHNDNDLFPNSNEHDHPTHSIQELSLKDHVRAVRKLLFQQKFFGLVTAERQGRTSEPEILRQKKILQPFYTSNEKKATRIGPEDNSQENSENEHDNNIAIDYYFGREKPTAVITPDVQNQSKTNNHIQKVGYLKGQNDTKELYVMDDFFKENVIKYITQLNTKDKTYINSDLIPATPMPMLNIKSNHDMTGQDILTIFTNKETKLNTETIKQSNVVTKSIANEELDILNMNNNNKNKLVDGFDDKDRIDPMKPVDNTNDTVNASPALNLRLNRRNDDVKVGVYLDVLKDMISLDNRALKQYDWLGSAVDIQASLQKLFELTGLVVNEEDIHPADMEILKYVVFLHKLATEIVEANDFGTQLRKKMALPRNKKKKLKPRFLKEKGLINRVWLYLRKEVPESNENGALKNLNKFLMDVEDGLFDLHDAIKHVAKITKYKNQNWYKNIKELYLNTDEKHLLELLLHMTVSRLFGLIEESAKNGLEDDYIQYMKRNRKESKKTLEELLFVMQIVNEINKF